MKFKTLLIGVLVTAYSLAQAQVNKQDFEKAVDYLNCKAVELSLEKSSTEAENNQFKQICKCQGNPDFDCIKSAIPEKTTKTRDLSEEINKLKSNEYKPNLKKQDAIKILTEDIFTDSVKYKKIVEFAKNRKKDGSFEKFSSSLKKEIDKFFPEINDPPVSSGQVDNSLSSLEKRLSAIEEQLANVNPEKKDWFDGITYKIYILISSAVNSLFILFILFRIFRHKKSEVSDNVKTYVKQKISDAVFNEVSPYFNNISNKITYLDKRIEYLEQHTDKINGINTSTQPACAPPKADNLEIEPSETKGETFYLSTPNSDGSFNNSSASTNYREGASIYRFTKISNNRAKFQIDEREASIKLALQYPDKNIDPVCDAENAFNSKAKTIITTGVGEAELVGDKWIKTNKAKIRYEN